MPRPTDATDTTGTDEAEDAAAGGAGAADANASARFYLAPSDALQCLGAAAGLEH